MRHRICGLIGLGNPSKEILNNSGKITKNIKTFFEESLKLYFKEYEGFDYNINPNSIMIGIEPSYQYDKLKIIKIDKDKNYSFIETGIAFGYYGSRICSTRKLYSDYKYNCKFKRFIDKYHKLIFTNKCQK